MHSPQARRQSHSQTKRLRSAAGTRSKLQNYIKQLRKAMKRPSKSLAPEAIHELHSQIGRLKTTLNTLYGLNSDRMHHLFGALEPIRKAAGKVRDLDVLVEHTCSLPDAASSEGLVQLIEQLGAKRIKACSKLHRLLLSERKPAIHCLKRCSNLINQGFAKFESGSRGAASGLPISVAARKLLAELGTWPRLAEGNIHSYRLRVKTARCILQLAPRRDTRLLRALSDVKDAIGEWHDWNELANAAARLLDTHEGNKELLLIQRTANEQLKTAVAMGGQLNKALIEPSKLVLNSVDTRALLNQTNDHRRTPDG
jgi:CHAD domain-containing protein